MNTHRPGRFHTVVVRYRYYRRVWNLAESKRKAFGRELRAMLVALFFAGFLLNFIDRLFDLNLHPLAELGLSGFRRLCHLLVNEIIVHTITLPLRALWYALQLVAAEVLGFLPRWPDWNLPGWLIDLSLVSFALTRIFRSTDAMVPAAVREKAGQLTPSHLVDAMYEAEGPFWGKAHRIFENTNERIWKLVNKVNDFFDKLLGRRLWRLKKPIHAAVELFFGIVLFWGLIRAGGYTINVIGAREIRSPLMRVRRRFVGAYLLHLIAAAFALIGFLKFHKAFISHVCQLLGSICA